jgi:hypothetical protein
MNTSRWTAGVGAACLVAGPYGQFAQFLVSPISEADSASAQVAQAAAHLTRMRWAIPLDLLILLVAPAVLYAGSLAGARVSKLAAIGSGLIFVTWLGAGYLLGSDVLLYVAAMASDPTAGAALVDGYLSHPVVQGVVAAYLAGHAVGFILLGVALARARAVPRWAAIAVAVWPFVEVAGEASGIRMLAAAGFALLALGFAGCAIVVVRQLGDSPDGAVRTFQVGSTAAAGT